MRACEDYSDGAGGRVIRDAAFWWLQVCFCRYYGDVLVGSEDYYVANGGRALWGESFWWFLYAIAGLFWRLPCYLSSTSVTEYKYLLASKLLPRGLICEASMCYQDHNDVREGQVCIGCIIRVASRYSSMQVALSFDVTPRRLPQY